MAATPEARRNLDFQKRQSKRQNAPPTSAWCIEFFSRVESPPSLAARCVQTGMVRFFRVWVLPNSPTARHHLNIRVHTSHQACERQALQLLTLQCCRLVGYYLYCGTADRWSSLKLKSHGTATAQNKALQVVHRQAERRRFAYLLLYTCIGFSYSPGLHKPRDYKQHMNTQKHTRYKGRPRPRPPPGGVMSGSETPLRNARTRTI